MLRLFLLSFTVLLFACTSPEPPSNPDVLARVGDINITRDRVDRAAARLFPKNAPATYSAKHSSDSSTSRFCCWPLAKMAWENDFQVKSKVAQREQELILDEMYRRGVVAVAEDISRDEARQYFEQHRIGQQRRLSRILASGPAAIDQVLSDCAAPTALPWWRANSPTTATPPSKAVTSAGRAASTSKTTFCAARYSEPNLARSIGPVQEPDGFSVFVVTDERKVPFEDMAPAVIKAMQEQKHAIATFEFLEGLGQPRRHYRTARDLRAALGPAQRSWRRNAHIQKGRDSASAARTRRRTVDAE